MAKRPSVTEQARRLTKGQINRRRFIMSAVASGVTLPTATALATKAEAHVPQRGGTLRMATADAIDRHLKEALPFYEVSEERDDGVTLTRRADHSDPTSGFFDAIEIRQISDAAARHRAILLGEVDYADTIDPQAVATLKGLGTLDVIYEESPHYLAGPMRTDVAPFDREEVRNALAASVDADALLSVTALGYGSIVPHVPDTTAGVATHALPLHFSEDAVPGSRMVAGLIQKQTLKHGLNVVPVEVSADTWEKTREMAGWHLTRGEGLPSDTAIPHIRLHALAAHVKTLKHVPTKDDPSASATDKVVSQWWFDTGS